MILARRTIETQLIRVCFIQMRPLSNTRVNNTPDSPEEDRTDTSSVASRDTYNGDDLMDAMDEKVFDYNSCIPGGTCHAAASKMDRGVPLTPAEQSYLEQIVTNTYRGVPGGSDFNPNLSYTENSQNAADAFGKAYIKLNAVWESGHT
jgi:hypothetical protein